MWTPPSWVIASFTISRSAFSFSPSSSRAQPFLERHGGANPIEVRDSKMKKSQAAKEEM